MDTLLKETVNATVNSRYPGMAPEGRKLIEEILIRKELERVNSYSRKDKSATTWHLWVKA